MLRTILLKILFKLRTTMTKRKQTAINQDFLFYKILVRDIRTKISKDVADSMIFGAWIFIERLNLKQELMKHLMLYTQEFE